MSRSPLLGVAAALLTALLGCNPPPETSATRAEQATIAACRERADRIYTVQNPASRLVTDQRDSPRSASYVEGITTRGLGERFAWDNTVSNCVRGNAGPSGPASTGPAMEPSGLTP